MAVTLEGGCRVSTMREGEPLVKGTLRVWNRIGRASGAQAISLRVMEFAPGLSPTIRNDDCDQILYVLDHDRVAGGDSSQGQAPSAPHLDHDSIDHSHPEGVRERKNVATIFINGNPFEI